MITIKTRNQIKISRTPTSWFKFNQWYSSGSGIEIQESPRTLQWGNNYQSRTQIKVNLEKYFKCILNHRFQIWSKPIHVTQTWNAITLINVNSSRKVQHLKNKAPWVLINTQWLYAGYLSIGQRKYRMQGYTNTPRIQELVEIKGKKRCGLDRKLLTSIPRVATSWTPTATKKNRMTERDLEEICERETKAVGWSRGPGAGSHKLAVKKVKVCFYMAQYPVRWTTQRALHWVNRGVVKRTKMPNFEMVAT